MTSIKKSLQDVKQIIIAQIISTLGDQLSLLASFSAILHKTGNPIEAASPLLVKGVVQFLFGLGSLQFIDRVSSKRLLIAADFLRFALIGYIAAAPFLNVPLILAIQAACTVIEIVFNAAREKLFNSHLDELEPKEQQHFAAVDNQLVTLLEVVGLGVGFAIIGGVSYRIAFGIDALTFLASAAVIWNVIDRGEKSVGSKIFNFTEIKGGLSAVLSNPNLSRSMLVRSLFWVSAGIFNMVELKLVSEYVPVWNPASTVALSKAILALGFVAGLEFTKRNAAKSHLSAEAENPQLFSYCALGNLLATVCTVAILLTRDLWLLGTVFFVYGVGTGLNSFGMRRIRQLATTGIPNMRGRVITITNMAAKTSEILGMLAVLVFSSADTKSTTLLLLISGSFMGISALLAGAQRHRSQIFVPGNARIEL